MRQDYLDCFPAATREVLSQFGIRDVNVQKGQHYAERVLTKEVTAFVGIVGAVQGHVSFCFSQETARAIAAVMMMSAEQSTLDAMQRSAIAEAANMFAAHAVTKLQEKVLEVDITTPSVVVGNDMYVILTFQETFTLELLTTIGPFEINIALDG